MHQIQFRLGLHHRHRCGSLQHSPDLLDEFKGPTFKEGKMGAEWEEEERDEREQKGREEEGTPKVGSHPIMSGIGTVIAGLISLVGAATQTFSPGEKHRRTATADAVTLLT